MAKVVIPVFQKDSYGIIFSFQTGIDLSDTTSLKLTIVRADGSYFERTLADMSITNAALGNVTYEIQDGDFNLTGKYKGQLVDNSPGRYLPSKIFEFKVDANVR